MSLRARLERALGSDGAPSSDFDLNADTAKPEQTLRDAAVLVPIIEGPKASVLLTKRSSVLKHHPGQIAFPGGKVDATDADVVVAALREAREEVGLQSDQVDVLGTLAPHETVTGFNVTPVLALIPDSFVPVPEEGEVAEAFRVPFDHLMEPANYLIMSRHWRGQPRYYFTVPYGPYYVWGATARMLRALADRMGDAD
jgi:8-oxo-dGTP pyrophosphatase MutT (NUDIX family)